MWPILFINFLNDLLMWLYRFFLWTTVSNSYLRYLSAFHVIASDFHIGLIRWVLLWLPHFTAGDMESQSGSEVTEWVEEPNVSFFLKLKNPLLPPLSSFALWSSLNSFHCETVERAFTLDPETPTPILTGS